MLIPGADQKNRVCPVEQAGWLDGRFRRVFQNPSKIVASYLREGMTVLDLGCGPGFFTIPMARAVGAHGRVIAADLQEGMLEIVRKKVAGTELENRIVLHKCCEDSVGVIQKVDLALLFYVAHEIPDKGRLFAELAAVLKPGGMILMVEPPLHVSKKEFEETLSAAGKAGLGIADRPKLFMSKAAVLKIR
jgi:ubiquinone/menaquinone biosynthesis C-methylase UbiE